MEKIEKFLQKLTKREREKIIILVQKILNKKTDGLKVSKLAGFSDLYRIRAGKIRIIFRSSVTGNALINIDYRKDIYRNL